MPVEINGQLTTPYARTGTYQPSGHKANPRIHTCAHYPADGNKVAPDLLTALRNAGLRDGMTISSHHHFRNGDKVANPERIVSGTSAPLKNSEKSRHGY